jgi:cobalt/nickel transport system permease protein
LHLGFNLESKLVNLGLDEHAHLDSPLHRWDPRYKLIGLLGLIFAFSFIQDLRVLPLILAITITLYAVSKLPLSYLLTRLRYPGVFLLAMTILLPFFSGSTVIARFGPLALRQEGVLDLLLIVVRFVCILTVGLILFGSAPFLTTIKAMRALGLPPILADMMLLSYRYLFEIGRDLKTMETAMRLRNFHAHRFSLRALDALASVSGSLLVRSYEQAERVYKAMAMRGYGHQPQDKSTRRSDEFRACTRDAIALGGVLLLAVGVIAAEFFLRQI